MYQVEQMYKIAICDDNKRDIEILKKLILKTKIVDTDLFQFYTFESGEQLFFHQQMDFDAIIMDMQMGKMDGYETAMNLRKVDSNFLLVFWSGVIMPVPEHFKAGVFRYLEKNKSEEEIVSELNDIIAELVKRKERPHVICKYTGGKDLLRVYPESVLYIAIRGKGCQVFPYGELKERFPNETLRITQSLNQVEKVFTEEYGFSRIHNSYIVNMAYITNISRTSVKLVEGTELSVARSKVKSFQEAFARYGLK